MRRAPSKSIALLIFACGITACGTTEVPHPTADNVVPDSSLAARIGRQPSGVPDLQALAYRLRTVREVGRIDLTGNSTSTLKRVDDLWTAETGEVFLADSSVHRVAFVQTDGSVKGVVDEHGHKPHELKNVRRVAVTAAGTVITAGRSDDLLFFRPTPEGYGFAARTPLGGRPDDLCVLGDDVFARVASQRELIAHVRADGEIAGRFGDPYRVPDDGIQSLLSQGVLACIPTSSLVVAMFNVFPEIYAFAPDGTQRWVSRIEDFKRPRLVEMRQTGRSSLDHGQRDFADRVATLTDLDGKYILVQLMRVNPESGTPDAFHSYVLDAATGQGEYVGSSLPRMRGTHAGRLYGELPGIPLRLGIYAPSQP